MTLGTTIPAALVGVWDGARGFWRGRPVEIWEPVDGGKWATFHGAPDGGEQVPWFRYEPIADIALDLTHRPTRLEVIERWRVVTPRTTGGISGPWFSRMHRPNVQYLACGDLHAVARPVGRPSYLAYAVVVPALADLDPTDDTRLPDGARVVDVRALAIVCQHVFGGPS